LPQNFLLVSIAVGGLLYSLLRLWNVIGIYRRRLICASWTQTTAKVCDRMIDEIFYDDEGGRTFLPKVTYCYTALGEEFKKTISIGSDSFVKINAEKKLTEFADALEIYYNPEKPEESTFCGEKVTDMDVVTIFFFLPVSLIGLIWALALL